MRIVLDANVVAAAFAARGLCESILELCLDSHDIILSEHLLSEIHKKLQKKVKLPKKAADQIVALLRENATIVKPTPLPADSCRDPDDVKVLGAAVAAQADVIVTGDKDLLVLKRFRLIPILTPHRHGSSTVKGESCEHRCYQDGKTGTGDDIREQAISFRTRDLSWRENHKRMEEIFPCQREQYVIRIHK